MQSDWVALPRRSKPRWFIPPSPRRIFFTAIKIYYPISTLGLIGWLSAWFAGAVGLLRLLPRSSVPGFVLHAVADDVPSGGSFAASGGRDWARAVVLIVDADGSARKLLKVAATKFEAGRLMKEASNVESYASLLAAPLVSPRLLSAQPGKLAYEVVSFRIRPLAWRLPSDVASAMGEFSRQSSGGFRAHGDFAPWNLLRSGQAWTLLDWEHAQADAPPYYDIIHFFIQSHLLLGRPSIRALRRGIHGKGRVGRALRAFCEGASLDRAGILLGVEDYLATSAKWLSTTSNEVDKLALLRSGLLAGLSE